MSLNLQSCSTNLSQTLFGPFLKALKESKNLKKTSSLGFWHFLVTTPESHILPIPKRKIEIHNSMWYNQRPSFKAYLYLVSPSTVGTVHKPLNLLWYLVNVGNHSVTHAFLVTGYYEHLNNPYFLDTFKSFVKNFRTWEGTGFWLSSFWSAMPKREKC